MNTQQTSKKSHITKGLIGGCLIGVLGIFISVNPIAHSWEETAGLGALFRMRGVKPAPTDVVVVALDKVTADHLHLPLELTKWPRTIHAELVNRLSDAGAAVVAFDVVFQDPDPRGADPILAEAITQAGNIVLAEYLHKVVMPLLPGDRPRSESEVVVEKFVRPTPALAAAAAASAPFPLPKVPVRVSQYWTFKQSPSLTPTLPVAAFQIYAAGVYPDFCRLLSGIAPEAGPLICGQTAPEPNLRTLKQAATLARQHFTEHPRLPERMLNTLYEDPGSALAEPAKSRLRTLIRSFQDPASRFLNFYGPPGTIETISACQILSPTEKGLCKQTAVDLAGKAVFVGLSDRHRLDQKDGFYTVFSQATGFDISGVEVAATAFANLVEDAAIRPLPPVRYYALLFFLGLLLGFTCIYYAPLPAAFLVLIAGVLYFTGALYQFNQQALWSPLIIPLLIQAPMAYFGTLSWKFLQTRRESRKMREIFQMYLPKEVVDQLITSVDHASLKTTLVYGACLFTDAEKFTHVSEKMDPQILPQFMNQYFDTIFAPVKRYGGTVSDVKGDAMLAVWAAAEADPTCRANACLAALEIHRAVNQYDGRAESFRLHTRLGLHAGPISLGNIGAADHFEYRPAGDTVNTASRIENLNKRMGTRVLASEQVLETITGYLARKLGSFVFAGKSEVITVYELMGREAEATPRQRELCRRFEQGLAAFCRQDWDAAVAAFTDAATIIKKDGPSLFYLELCESYRHRPPAEWRDGVVVL